jgi:Cu+-exporting ATPase
VVSANGFGEQQIIAAASIAERKSEHPLAKAVMARATELAIPLVDPDQFSYTPGRGVRASYEGEEILVGSLALFVEHGMTRGLPMDGNAAGGTSEVYVARAGQVLGSIRIADVLRPEAKNAVAAMRQMGLRTVLLSGDTRAATSSVGRDLGVDEAVGGLLPEQKAKWVTELRSKGRNVAMVGDGINDAPALAQSDVGISMPKGTDIAIEASDIALMRSDLRGVPAAISLSRQTMATMKQNLFWAFVYNVIGIPIAAGVLYPFTGLMLSPIIASAAMALSSVSVVTNSLRLRHARVA